MLFYYRRALVNSHSDGDGGGEAANKKRKLNNVHGEELVCTDGTKVLALPSGPVTCNSTLSKHIDIVKPYIRELVEHANLVSLQ